MLDTLFDRVPGVDHLEATVTPGNTPLGVIFVHADTLRADHLDAYGYHRQTGPNIRRMAQEGALFKYAMAQAGWTKVSTPSFVTGLYPSTTGVFSFPDRLPASATTIAEAFSMEILDPGERGTMVGLRSAAQQTLSGLGAFLGARLMAGGDYVTPFLVMAATYAASAVFFWLWFRPIERGAQPTHAIAVAGEPAD